VLDEGLRRSREVARLLPAQDRGRGLTLADGEATSSRKADECAASSSTRSPRRRDADPRADEVVNVDAEGRIAAAETGLTAGRYTTATGEHGLTTGLGDTG
jgi:hypothetical protein